jgi:hypothetical protein
MANFDDFWHYAKMTPFYADLYDNYIKNRWRYHAMIMAYKIAAKKFQ